ncbi:FtsK/SpoIIIE domain-containing protein [Pseudolysinimonas sp.]|uniref:FtsK/SpoIIIE domain-containing protein n=1 Tax=Pseudolysinimonas sp. TaxID=2680009 RepID=UPI003F807A31
MVLAELLAAAPPPEPGALAAPIGRDADGVVTVDLVADGPHALVGGTTGSGKSELLVSWVLSMAHGRSPDDVGFLLIDFKGGAAFAPLAGVPHVVGILSDLDARQTRRAIESLRAELLRRERLLAEAGVRAIGDLPRGTLARLVVVVDEFAAVVAGQPELHEVFGDLAARGRSLGLHLVLCTQRPAGVVRDGVLANVTLRIGLRMTDRGDSIALLGDEGAARIPAEPRGRAVLAAGPGSRAFQVAIAGPPVIAAARATATAVDRGSGADGRRPWLDPLPTPLPLADVGEPTADGIPFGRVDLPSEQRQPIAVHRPASHGHLLVLGATGAGRTTALAVLGRVPRAVALPGDPADAWQVLEGLLRAPDDADPARRRLLVADDLDLLLARADPETRHELGELLARLLREASARGVGVVAGAQRAAGPLQPLLGLFGSRLVLRMPSREEHVLAGGTGAEYDPALPPGAGRWRGAVVQVAWPGPTAMPPADPPPLAVAEPYPGRPLAVVAARPGSIRESLAAAGLRVSLVGAGAGAGAGAAADGESDAVRSDACDVLLGDPDAWQADWTLLGRARRELPVAVVGCTAAELRALTRTRDAVPPLGARPGECWLVDGGVVRRALLRGVG